MNRFSISEARSKAKRLDPAAPRTGEVLTLAADRIEQARKLLANPPQASVHDSAWLRQRDAWLASVED